ncbi:organic anion transporter 7-like [Ursus arctos]|uniref:organic anion transporter 7-like n=1 Tax=Ursus arctos TaxID=9644 RepID=UPI001CF90E99|nr:organic anion transporter 7-like [Ursus arctos]
MQKDLEAAKIKPSMCDSVHAFNLHKGICALSSVRLATAVLAYGLTPHLQHMREIIFLFQILSGFVNLPGNWAGVLAMNHLGRRVSQMIFMFLLGISILAITFVPRGEKRAWGRKQLLGIPQGLHGPPI